MTNQVKCYYQYNDQSMSNIVCRRNNVIWKLTILNINEDDIEYLCKGSGVKIWMHLRENDKQKKYSKN